MRTMMRFLLAAAVAATGALAAGAAPAQAGNAEPTGGLQIRLADNVPLKLTSFKRLDTGAPARSTNAGNTVCYVESPFGPQLATGPQMQVAFTMRCQDITTGFPSTETSLAYLMGDIRRTNGAFHGPTFENAGANTAVVVAIASVAAGVFKGHVVARVIYLNVPYEAEYDTVRTLEII